MMKKPKMTADEGIHRAFVRAMKAEDKAGAGKRGLRAPSSVGWELNAVPPLRATAAALGVRHEFVVHVMSKAVALIALVFSALKLFHH
ncbi:MAG TPA: hypothetical protein VG963_32715 [Polyangiaceae bacterium]|nr:hypothetical protein [Polyangiaceae bacterium]